MFSLLPLLPPLHIGGPEPTEAPYTHWIIDPSIAVYIIILTAAYLFVVGPLNRRRPRGLSARRPPPAAGRRAGHPTPRPSFPSPWAERGDPEGTEPSGPPTFPHGERKLRWRVRG